MFNDPVLLQLGAGGLLAYVILKETFNFLGRWKNGRRGDRSMEDYGKMLKELKESSDSLTRKTEVLSQGTADMISEFRRGHNQQGEKLETIRLLLDNRFQELITAVTRLRD